MQPALGIYYSIGDLVRGHAINEQPQRAAGLWQLVTLAGVEAWVAGHGVASIGP
jgi:hypothetical protein